MTSIKKYWMVIFLCLASLCVPRLDVIAQQNTDYSKFQKVIQQLKGWKQYSYKVKASGYISNGNYGLMDTRVFVDKITKQIFYEDKGQLLVINTKYILQIDHNAKVFKVFNRKEYERIYNGKVNNIQSLFKDDLMHQMLDSFMVKNKNVKLRKSNLGKEIFTISDSDDYLSMLIDIHYEPHKSMLEKIDFSLKDVEDDNKMLINTTMYDYRLGVDASIFDMREYFQVAPNGDIKALRYTNYKLLTKIK